MRRHLRRLLCSGVAALAVVGLVPVAAVAAPTTAPPAHPTVASRVVTTFPRGSEGSFAESAAVARDGTVYVALTTWKASGWNVGQIYRVRADGRTSTYGPALDVGVLTGLAFDSSGRLYVAVASWTDPAVKPVASGVLRVDATSATRVLTLPTGPQATSSFPNGLVFLGRDLYVSDSVRGVIWRTTPRGDRNDVVTHPWLAAKVLAPSKAGAIGVNGLAVRDGHVYAVVSDTGTLVRVDLARGHRPVVHVVTRSARLLHADGIAVDTAGRFWVAVNGAVPKSGSIVRIDQRGTTVVVGAASWTDYPTQVAFGPSHHGRSTLYVTNGAFLSGGTSSLVALTVDARGAGR